MTQHVDEVARAISDVVNNPEDGRLGYEDGVSEIAAEIAARAAMRAVVKHLREPSEEMIWAGKLSASKFGDVREVFCAMLDAYTKEAGIDE